MVSTTRTARISGLLDSARDELESVTTEPRVRIVRAMSRIDEAQRLLLTDEPESDPRDN